MTSEFRKARAWVWVFLLAGLFLAALSISQFIGPATQATAAGGAINRIVFWLLGPRGPAIVSAVLAAAFLCGARMIWRHTPKTPCDRLWF